MKALQKQMKEEGLKSENGGYTFTQTAKIYLDDTKYRKRSITTMRGYKQLLNNWILPDIGDIKLRSITEQDLEKLYDKMRRSTNPQTGQLLSETYVNHCHKLVSSIFTYAKKKKWILSNPAEFVLNPPKLKIKQRDYYSYEEMMEVFKLLKNEDIRFQTAIFTLFNTGFRRGELLGLKWSDVVRRKMPITHNGVRTFQVTNILNIERELMKVNKSEFEDPNFINKYNIIEIICEGLVAIKPKTDKSIRKIVVVDEVYDQLMKYKQFQITNGFIPKDSDYVFRTHDFINAWDPNYLTKEWARFVKLNNLKPITVHDIRHSHATYLLSIGIPPQDVARRLGHSEPSTTLRIYTHSNLLQDQKLVDLMARNIYDNNVSLAHTDPFSVLSILFEDPNMTSNDDLFNTLDYFYKEEVTIDDSEKYMLGCKKYLIDKFPELNELVDRYEKIDDDSKRLLTDCMKMIINYGDTFFPPIEDKTKYIDKEINI